MPEIWGDTRNQREKTELENKNKISRNLGTTLISNMLKSKVKTNYNQRVVGVRRRWEKRTGVLIQ